MSTHLSPKQVAQAIGVSEASLKRWCDKGLLSSERTPGGHRRLAIVDVLEFLRQTGRRPVDPSLLKLPVVRSPSEATFNEAADWLTQALIVGDEQAAERVIFDLYLAKATTHEIGDSVIRVALQAIGEKWECADLEPYQERRACEICGRIVNRLREVIPRPIDSAPLAIGGTFARDAYRIPSALVELTLREFGWRAESLGTGLPAKTMCAAIESLNPQLFWLSVSHMDSVTEFQAQFAALYECAQRHRVLLAVGGRALTPELREGIQYTVFCDRLAHLASFVAGMQFTRRRMARKK